LFKLGVCRLDQYQAESPAGGWGKLSQRLARNRIGFHLFRTQIPATPEQIALFEKAIPFVRLSSGIYRTTFRGRFRGFDEHVNDLLAGKFDPATALRVEDWAASDCLASSEWAASLFARFPSSTLTASDLTMFLIEVAVPGGESYIIETNGELLQYIRPPFVICVNPSEPRLLVVNSFLESRARAKFQAMRKTWNIPDDWLDAEDNEVFEQPPFLFRKIPLIHPDAQTLQWTLERFAIRRHSVFELLEHPCDVIRTMNIFNLSYFPKARIREGIRAVRGSLSVGGVWIVGRTIQENPPLHSASIFIREATRFRLLDQVGPGSEIQDLALEEQVI
jgi:hypothetical protein